MAIFKWTAIHAALSTRVLAAETNPGNVDNAQRSATEHILRGPFVPQNISSSHDQIADTAQGRLNTTTFDTRVSPATEHRNKRVQTLRNPSVSTGMNDNPVGTENPASRTDEEFETMVFDATTELGILSNSKEIIRRELLECGGNHPLVDAKANFPLLVNACITNVFCPYLGEIGCWNTSQVTDMSQAFSTQAEFNEPIGAWDTSRVTDMSTMFSTASAFNQPMDSWDTSRVTDMNGMFYRANAFNQPIGSWEMSAVRNTRIMFSQAFRFNHSIDSWDTSGVTNMSYMFSAAVAFNQPLDSWNTSSVTMMHMMLWQAQSFNQCLSSWAEKVSGEVTTSYMLTESGCPHIVDPKPNIGPWCQGVDEQCFSSATSTLSSSGIPSPTSQFGSASAVALGILIPNIVFGL